MPLSKPLSLLGLALITSFITPPVHSEDPPEVSSGPDFYNQPGINQNRAYDSQENILVDPFSGSMQVHYTDLVVPGKGLDISINRSYNSASNKYFNKGYAGARWSIHFGKLDQSGYVCDPDSGLAVISKNSAFIKPDGGTEPLLPLPSIHADIDGDGDYDPNVDYKPRFISPSLWKAECDGEDFRVTDTSGTHYYIGGKEDDWHVVKIEDIHGNYLLIDYIGERFEKKPSKISASDGRVVNFTYETKYDTDENDNEISAIVLSSISYIDQKISYDVEIQDKYSTRLVSVTRPDFGKSEYTYIEEGLWQGLNGHIESIKNPYGLITTFEYDKLNHLGNYYPVVKEKCRDTQCWTYEFSREADENNRTDEITTISGPDGVKTYRHYGYFSIDRDSIFSAIWQMGLLKSMIHTYDGIEIYKEENEWDYFNVSGVRRKYAVNNSFVISDSAYKSPVLKKKTVTQDGSTYIYSVLEKSIAGWPILIKEEGTKSVFKKTDYGVIADIDGNWKMPLVISEYVGSSQSELKEVSQNTYSTKGKLSTSFSNGIKSEFTYYASGELKEEIDGVGNITSYSDYLYGIPRRVDYPDGGYEQREVDIYGRVISETNAHNVTTYYSYDKMNRLIAIDNPISQDIEVDFVDFGKTEIHKRGNLKQTNVYNKRKLLLSKTVEDIVTGKKFVELFEYDDLDRLIFKSRINDPLKGINYDYDPLGRMVKTETTDERVTVIDYIDGETRQVTNPLGNQVIYTYETFSNNNKQVQSIEAPEGVLIEMTYNELGQPLTVSQNGVIREYGYNENWQLNYYKEPEKDGHMTFSYDLAGRKKADIHYLNNERAYNKLYNYDELGRVKEVIDPYYYYDYLDQEYRYKTECKDGREYICEVSTISLSTTIDYDLLGNITSKKRFKEDLHVKVSPWFEQEVIESETSWNYQYDTAGRLIEQKLLKNIDGGEESYTVNHTYNSLDNLVTTTYPSNYNVNYSPDTFGRPTEVGSIVTSIDYYDSGSIKEIVYGNGQATKYMLNEQLLPESMTVASTSHNVIDYGYEYDSVGNLKSIVDSLDSSNSISMSYDGLDRLIAANGSWGVGSFEYDELGNIQQKTIGSVTKFYSYDLRNRLSNFSGFDFSYDIAGQVTGDGKKSYSYDHSNRLIYSSIDGESSPNLVMEYDANDRLFLRKSINKDGDLIASKKTIYSQSGQLLHEVRERGDFKRDHIYLGSKLVGYHDTKVDCFEDFDGDGMQHCYERENGLDPYLDDASEDSDNDGLTNLEEYQAGTRADRPDTDGDGMPDDYEVSFGLDALVADANADMDDDGFSNFEEYTSGLNPTEYDTLSSISQVKIAGDSEHTVLFWDKVEFALGYRIYWSDSPEVNVSTSNSVDVTNTVYYHEVPELGKDYYYKVVVYNNKQESIPSTEVTAFGGTKIWKKYVEVRDRPNLMGNDLDGRIYTLTEDYDGSNRILTAHIYEESGGVREYELKNSSEYVYDKKLLVSESGYAYAIWKSLHGYHIKVYSPELDNWNSYDKSFIAPSGGSLNLLDYSLHPNGSFVYAMSSTSGWQKTASMKRFIPDTGWSESFVLSYPNDRSSPYYNVDFERMGGVDINQSGSAAAFWELDKNEGGDVNSYHIVNVSPNGTMFKEMLQVTDSPLTGDIILDGTNGGTVVWKNINIDETVGLLTQKFNSEGLIGESTSLDSDSYTPGDYIHIETLPNNKLAVFSSDKNDGYLRVHEEFGSSWSNVIASNYKVEGDSIYTDHATANGGWPQILVNEGGGKKSHLQYTSYNGIEKLTPFPITSRLTIAGQAVKAKKQPDVIVDELPGEPPQTVPGKWELSLYEVSKEATFSTPPVAKAGSDITADEFTAITLDGRSSVDPDGQIVEYLWEYNRGGFGAVKIDDATKALTEARLPTVDNTMDITFSLTVTDNTGVTDTEELVVTVNDIGNAAPYADAGSDRLVFGGDTVSLGINDSYDPDSHGGLSYSWRVISGGSLPIEQAPDGGLQFVAPSVANDKDYTLEITVTDSDGASSKDTVIITVAGTGGGGNYPPVADAGDDQSFDEGSLVILDGSNSYAQDGGDVSLDWEVINGEPLYFSNGPFPGTVSFEAPEVGQATDFLIRLTATDSQGASSTDDVIVTVNDTNNGGGGEPSNLPPVADAGLSKTVNEETVVILDGRNSYDPEGDPLNLSWSVLSGGSLQLEQGPEPGTLQFTAPNITPSKDYELQLTVTDSKGASGTDDITISVTDLDGGPNNQPPVADGGSDQTVSEGDTVIIDPRNSYDPDGYSLNLGISIVSGGYLPLESGSEQGTFQFIAPDVTSDKTYTLRITVTDADGASSSDDINVTVTPQQ